MKSFIVLNLLQNWNIFDTAGCNQLVIIWVNVKHNSIWLMENMSGLNNQIGGGERKNKKRVSPVYKSNVWIWGERQEQRNLKNWCNSCQIVATISNRDNWSKCELLLNLQSRVERMRNAFSNRRLNTAFHLVIISYSPVFIF